MENVLKYLDEVDDLMLIAASRLRSNPTPARGIAVAAIVFFLALP